MGRKELDGLVSDLGKEIGIPDLALDEESYGCLFVDDVALNLEYDEEGNRLLLYTRLGEAPERGRESFYETLLDANLFWKGTGGATIGLDKETGGVLLAYGFDLDGTSLADFKTVVENFVNIAETWIGRVRDFEPEEKGEAPPGPVMQPGLMA